MILNNYWNLASYMHSHNITFDNNVWQNLGVKNLSGSEITQIWANCSYSSSFAQFSVACAKNHSLRLELDALLGTGTTTPEASDYCLDNDITNNIANLSVTSNTGADEDGLKTIVTISGTNLTGNEITISEIGITKTIYYFDQQWTNVSSSKSLMARELLNNPITVPNGQGFTLTFEWLEA